MQAQTMARPSVATRTRDLSRFAWEDAAFVLAAFVLGRAIVFITFLIVAPKLPVPPGGISPVPGWQIFERYDGVWYHEIATQGYEYARDRAMHSVAFFPLFPLIVTGLVRLGLHVGPAAVFVSNACFFAMLAVAYDWIRTRHGIVVARWAIATLALLPPAIYGAVAYSEALFMLLTALALRDFDRGHTWRAALWSALASATRFAGIALAGAFALDALVKRKPLRAWLAVAIAPLGTIAYAAFQYARFGDPIAFVHTEVGWHRLGLTSQWLLVFDQTMIARHHVAIVAAYVVAAVAYRFVRPRLGRRGDYVAAFLTVAIWGRLWGWQNDMKLLFIFVAAYAVVRFYKYFTIFERGYAAIVFALIAAAGDPFSTDRYAYSMLVGTVALAFLWRRYPSLGYITLALGTGELAIWSLKFAQDFFLG